MLLTIKDVKKVNITSHIEYESRKMKNNNTPNYNYVSTQGNSSIDVFNGEITITPRNNNDFISEQHRMLSKSYTFNRINLVNSELSIDCNILKPNTTINCESSRITISGNQFNKISVTCADSTFVMFKCEVNNLQIKIVTSNNFGGIDISESKIRNFGGIYISESKIRNIVYNGYNFSATHVSSFSIWESNCDNISYAQCGTNSFCITETDIGILRVGENKSYDNKLHFNRSNCRLLYAPKSCNVLQSVYGGVIEKRKIGSNSIYDATTSCKFFGDIKIECGN